MQVFDASSMIYAWDNYPVRQFPPLWKWIALQMKEKKLVMPTVAFKEVTDKTPECGVWLKENNLEQIEISNAIMQDAITIKGLLEVVNDNYHPRGVDENDILIIASAKHHKNELVSEEARQRSLPKDLSKRKIPAVCAMSEISVSCINFIEFIKGSNKIFKE